MKTTSFSNQKRREKIFRSYSKKILPDHQKKKEFSYHSHLTALLFISVTEAHFSSSKVNCIQNRVFTECDSVKLPHTPPYKNKRELFTRRNKVFRNSLTPYKKGPLKNSRNFFSLPMIEEFIILLCGKKIEHSLEDKRCFTIITACSLQEKKRKLCKDKSKRNHYFK